MTDNGTHEPDQRLAETGNGMYYEYEGGVKGHIFRRVYHVVATTLMAPMFYWYIGSLSDFLHISVSKMLSIVILLQVAAESSRLYRGVIVFSQREYERHQICAQAWGTVALCLVFLLAYPRAYSIAPVFDANRNQTSYNQRHACYAQIGLPIIWSLAIGDPLIGEMKRLGYSTKQRCLAAWAVVCCIYIVCTLWCGTQWWLVFIMPVVAVAAEYPSLRIIDDNGMMLLVPLLLSLVLEPWFTQNCQTTF